MEKIRTLKQLTTLFLPLPLIILSGCGSNPAKQLPGSFPETGSFKAPYYKNITIDDFVGDWNLMANGRVFKITINNNNGKIAIDGNSGIGVITDEVWSGDSRRTAKKLTFKRTKENSAGELTSEQIFTGYFMHYSHTNRNGGIPDYKRRIAGTFEQIRPTGLTTGQFGSWYATQPASTQLATCKNKPNLIVSNAQVNISSQTVTVSVKNIGDKDAGNHLTYIDVSEVDSAASPQSQYSARVSGIAAGSTWNSGAIPFSDFGPLNLSVFSNANLVVRADAKGFVDECNENDNIYEQSVIF